METDFERTLPAIWLIFGGTYLNHTNGPKCNPDDREQQLVDLLHSFVADELKSSSTKQSFDSHTKTQLLAVCELLQLWSKDLDHIYRIREFWNDSEVQQLARLFLKRVRSFTDCIIIPNGLISAKHAGVELAESVSLGIVTKKNDGINWIQVNPGSVYHQHCEHVAGEKCNAYLEILDFDPNNITEDWLYLLVGLKTVKVADYEDNEKLWYNELSLYEGLLSHLNGKTVSKSKADEGFIVSSHASPVHTWHVVDQSFRYLLRHFLGDNYYAVYQQLLTNFKMFVMKETLAFYQDGVRWLSSEGVEQRKQCHFLLQEMCRDVAQYALDYGNEQQKASSLQLINSVKAAMKKYCSQEEELVCPKFQLENVQVLSLHFDEPNLVNHRRYSFRTDTPPNLLVDPVFIMPEMNEDIVNYLLRLKFHFIDELKIAQDLQATALLSYGIEEFFINFLAETDILEKSPYSESDTFLAKTPEQLTFIAKTLEELGGIYYGCQSRIVNNFLANSTYQPQFYAKNVTIQFFVYAAVAALNYRDPIIGPLLEKYYLSTVLGASLKLENIILQLVIEDYRWVKILLRIQAFFAPKQRWKPTLFSNSSFTRVIRNDANEEDAQVAFAYKLLQKYPDVFEFFTEKFQDLKNEKLNMKWIRLAYTESQLFLPSIYCVLFKVANLAKVSLTGFPSNTNKNFVRTGWKKYKKPRKTVLFSKVMFIVNDCMASSESCSDSLTSYLIKQNQNETEPYQKFITSKEKDRGNGNNVCFHFLENEIIANQDGKPGTMDSNRYMLLGFLQSEPWIKLERLYIALKEMQLDFSCEEEVVLIKQALFEISVLCADSKDECSHSVLDWTARINNPDLILKFGLLCTEKALAMKHRLSQHHAIGEILLVSLALLTFCAAKHQDQFIKGIIDIYNLLKEVLANPPAHLSDNTLLHLNAYLIIAAQAKPQSLETETLTILRALLAIQNYKVKKIRLENCWSLRVHVASFKLSSWVELQLIQNPTLLNDLMLTIVPEWDCASFWQKSDAGLLFTCNDYAIKPLLGGVFFRNLPNEGLPDEISGHSLFKEYLGETSLSVTAASCQMSTQQVLCYFSVDRTPPLKLTLIGSSLLIEEQIGTDYERLIPAQELSSDDYPRFLFESPQNKEKLRHWLHKDTILIKNDERQVLFEWNLTTNVLFSSQHEGYVVPWKNIQASHLKTCLENIESPRWIQLIAKQSSINSDVCIESLNFPRLGLYFNEQEGQLFSKQVYGYVIAKQQRLNTLHGYRGYLVLERNEQNSVREHIKVIIPHRKVYPRGPFYVNTADVNRNKVRTPAYFVYDYDSKMGLLKGHHIRAHLYLALLYFRSASFDEDELSHCNAYHLARENLELCWKDQPYDNIELSIIEQLLDVSAIHQRGLHSHLVALYLKVVSLLSSSLRLSFLFTDESIEQNKKRSCELLERCAYVAPHFLVIYLQNKSHIFARIRLTEEEEKDAVKYCSPSVEKDDVKIPCSSKDMKDAEDYFAYFLPNVKKCYNAHYQQFFSEQELITTAFQRCFQQHLSVFNFAYDTKNINFASGIHGIVRDRFHINNFITLYNIAKTSAVSVDKYRYLFHHLLCKAKVYYKSVGAELLMMLGQALLLVAENPVSFPDSPRFDYSFPSVNLVKCQVIKTEVFKDFPPFTWTRLYHLNDFQNNTAKEEARKRDEQENELIWLAFRSKDLDKYGIPCILPEDPNDFTLRYERCIKFSNNKRSVVRKHYLQAAYNESMYQFFACILQKCDELKYGSKMGLYVVPFVHNTITMSVVEEEKVVSPATEAKSLEKWAVPQKSLINLTDYFALNSLQTENNEYLFESQLDQQNGYQQQFHRELKESWSVYTKEEKRSYSWLKAESAIELEFLLRKKYTEIHCQAEEIWNKITAQFNLRSNTKSNDYFALRWFSGQVRHYHKCDILRLLIEPQNISSYNPDCVESSDDIIQELLQYATHEINCVKIVNVLALMEQYKQAESDSEKFSAVQSLVKSLQESLDPASYRYPHWFLFQLENGIIVRENQRELIDAMSNQKEKAMYQLNMGEGKSSVILPLLSCNLANGQQLLRINVLSALLTTMKEFLRQRFSGLFRKHVYTLPFNRDTDISAAHLQLIFKTLETCKNSQHILLTTPEHRLCLQLKSRELMLENQQQIDATNIFNWETYRQRAHSKMKVYRDLNDEERESLLLKQDQCLRTCLRNEKYIDSNNKILKVPPRERRQVYKEFARFKELINDTNFREWSCLKAAYRELLYDSSIAFKDCSEKLALLAKISAVTATDLLDESDEILKHGTELNYTVGDRHVFAGGELRWQLPQFFIKSVFCDSELKKIISEGVADGFTTINLNFSSQGGVPFIQLHDKSYYEEKIKPALLDKFFKANLPFLQTYHCNADDPIVQGETYSIRKYIAGELVQNAEKEVMKVLADKGALKDRLLIAKGWLSHGILFHVFNAKYRVQYGLHLSLSKQIAIPFFGKDTPSPRSEFSHPDVMLGLTIISYLYQGLSQTQLKKTLVKLKDKFAPSVADMLLRAWTQAGRMWIESETDKFPPFALESFQHLDLEEEHCLALVHKYLSGNSEGIFFYLNEYVLLEEAMQYLYKISANAHSLVGYDAALGFSGTDDRKITMPFEVKSLRSISELGTNGKLLSVLTQNRNKYYYSLCTEDTVTLLKNLCEYAKNQRGCHALIDAGALVTGLSNRAVAEFLLTNLPSHFLGILYFSDEGNSLTVLTRDKKTLSLQDCYLDKQYLFAYLDDIHTRGTDIQLPLNCHAMLTVGLGMEKDKLMQAAMRLRHLAQEQSVSLWGTQAVTLAIKRDNKLEKEASINSFEVIKWVTQNTIDHINTDLYPVGIRRINFQFLRKAEALLREAPTKMNSLIQYCQEKELFQLEEFYAISPQSEDLVNRLDSFVSSCSRIFWQNIEHELQSKQLTGTAFNEKVSDQLDRKVFKAQLTKICDELSPYLQCGYVRDSLDGDEEKEVEVEVIQEQEVVIEAENREACIENQWNVQLTFEKDFVLYAEQAKIIMPLNQIKDFIKVPANLSNIIWHRDIYMTANYVHSVKSLPNERLDNYLRPVDVVLMHRSAGKSSAVLLSGQEASWIKQEEALRYGYWDEYLLMHINDIDGPTQLAVGNTLSKNEQKLLTVIKLFSGECRYTLPEEVRRVAKRVGRLYPLCFTSLPAPNEKLKTLVSTDVSKQLFNILVKDGFLDVFGIMTEKLFELLQQVELGESLSLNLPTQYRSYNDALLKKLYRIYSKLIVVTSSSLKSSHESLQEWVGTRGRLREYPGSELESILSSEYDIK